MIDSVRLYESVNQAAKKGTSGYQSPAEFNRDLSDVQTDLLTTLRPHFESNQMVRDLLGPFVVSTAVSSSKPVGYYSFISATISGQPSWPIALNEVAIYQSSPVRSPAASGQSYHYFQDDQVMFLTPSGVSGSMSYIRYPSNAGITATPVSDDDSDYMTITSNGDLEWPESAFNFILYMMLAKLGVETKEPLLREYAAIGIQYEQSKIQ